VCASAETPIATGDGERPIASLHPGDLVYSADHGALRLVPLLEVSRTAVFHHRVIELRLSNGALLRMLTLLELKPDGRQQEGVG
jgi:hypothetical protein